MTIEELKRDRDVAERRVKFWEGVRREVDADIDNARKALGDAEAALAAAMEKR